jgi:hypothetical protein
MMLVSIHKDFLEDTLLNLNNNGFIVTKSKIHERDKDILVLFFKKVLKDEEKTCNPKSSNVNSKKVKR